MFAARGFFGSGTTRPNLTDLSLFDINTGESDAEAYVIFGNTGALTTHTDTVGDNVVANQWLTSIVTPAEAGLYELVLTVTSGHLDYGSNGTFNLATSRKVGCYMTANAGNQTATVTAQIRRVADSLVMATATLDFDVESSNA